VTTLSSSHHAVAISSPYGDSESQPSKYKSARGISKEIRETCDCAFGPVGWSVSPYHAGGRKAQNSFARPRRAGHRSRASAETFQEPADLLRRGKLALELSRAASDDEVRTGSGPAIVIMRAHSLLACSPMSGPPCIRVFIGTGHPISGSSGSSVLRPQRRRTSHAVLGSTEKNRGGSGAKLAGAVPSRGWAPQRDISRLGTLGSPRNARSLRGSRSGSGPERFQTGPGRKASVNDD
jgi:hypothetical protein